MEFRDGELSIHAGCCMPLEIEVLRQPEAFGIPIYPLLEVS